jgi:secondary thiamine-phosphate synthase enzyme
LSTLSAIRSTKADTIATARLTVETSGEGFFEITAEVKRFLNQAGARNGTVLIYLRHTSASVVIQENADPDVRIDLLTALRRLAPADAGWVHDVEGPDDMPGHVKSMLNGVSLQVPVDDGNLGLGAWQGIYVAEHRITPHRREVILQFCGSCADSTTARD